MSFNRPSLHTHDPLPGEHSDDMSRMNQYQAPSNQKKNQVIYAKR